MGFLQLTSLACLVLCSAWIARAAPVMTLVGSSTQVSVHAMTDPTHAPSTTDASITEKAEPRSDDSAAPVAVSEQTSTETSTTHSSTMTSSEVTSVPASEAQQAGDKDSVQVTASSLPSSSPDPVQADQPSPKTEEVKPEDKSHAEEPAKEADAAKEKVEGRTEQTEKPVAEAVPEPVKEAAEQKPEEAVAVPVEPPAEPKQPETSGAVHEEPATVEPKTSEADPSPVTTQATEVSSEAPASHEPAHVEGHAAMEAHVEVPAAAVEHVEALVETMNPTKEVSAPEGNVVAAAEDKERDEPVQSESDVSERTVAPPAEVERSEAVEKPSETMEAEKVTTETASHHSGSEVHAERADDVASTAAPEAKAPEEASPVKTDVQQASTEMPAAASTVNSQSTPSGTESAEALPKAALNVEKAAEELLTSTHKAEEASTSTQAAVSSSASEDTSSASPAASDATTTKVEAISVTESAALSATA